MILPPLDLQWLLIAWAYLHTGDLPEGANPPHFFVNQVAMVARTLMPDDIPPGFEGYNHSTYYTLFVRNYGSPPFHHALTLPGVEALDAQRAFGEAHFKWLEGMKNLHPLNSHFWDERIADMNWRLGIYKLAREVASDRDIALKAFYKIPRDAQSISCYVHYSSWVRSEMRTLEEMLGPDIRLGILPPIVPTHSFRRIP